MENSWKKIEELPFNQKVVVKYQIGDQKVDYVIGQKKLINRDIPIPLFFLSGGGSLRLESIIGWYPLENYNL